MGIFERLEEACERNEYKWLLSLVYSSMADASNSNREYSNGRRYSIQFLNISDGIQNHNGEMLGAIQVAVAYKYLGDSPKLLDSLQQSLQATEDSPLDNEVSWIIYDVAAQAFSSLSLLSAALEYEMEALRIANVLNRPLNLLNTYAHLSFINSKMKNHEGAIAQARLAYTTAQAHQDESARLRMMAYASLYLGETYRQSGYFDQAIASYDRNISIYNDLNYAYYGYVAHQGKLLCYLAQGNNLAAKQELGKTLELFEQYRSKIAEESLRNSFSDSQQNIYDLAVDFEYSRMNDPQTAFERSEASRAKSLRDLIGTAPKLLSERYGPDLEILAQSDPLKLTEIQAQVPERVQLLQYAALDDKLIIWVISKTGFSCVEVKVGYSKLSEKVNDYLPIISHQPKEDSGEEADKAWRIARELFDLLIKPVESLLDKNKLLCIVPDKVLSRLPFAALVSSGSGKYLISDYQLSFAPSSTIFVKCSEIALQKNRVKAEKLLSVGNPHYDYEVYQSLGDLSESETEANTIAALYQSKIVLTRDRARENQVVKAMAGSNVIHLATHYVTDDYSPLLSKLLLTKEAGDNGQDSRSNGFLQPYEIYLMNLPNTRLVVLSACETGIERSYRGEGAISLARPFIAAGVPVVVASLWKVESESTTKLMIGFHKHRKQDGMTTAESLRQAQLALINSSNHKWRHPYYWAAFTIVGGDAAY
jgi:CHAT domain-containing protein